MGLSDDMETCAEEMKKGRKFKAAVMNGKSHNPILKKSDRGRDCRSREEQAVHISSDQKGISLLYFPALSHDMNSFCLTSDT